VSLEFQAKVHEVGVKILKALFIGLGWDESIIDEVRWWCVGVWGALRCAARGWAAGRLGLRVAPRQKPPCERAASLASCGCSKQPPALRTPAG
jgi:hypothetical protein